MNSPHNRRRSSSAAWFAGGVLLLLSCLSLIAVASPRALTAKRILPDPSAEGGGTGIPPALQKAAIPLPPP